MTKPTNCALLKQGDETHIFPFPGREKSCLNSLYKGAISRPSEMTPLKLKAESSSQLPLVAVDDITEHYLPGGEHPEFVKMSGTIPICHSRFHRESRKNLSALQKRDAPAWCASCGY